MVKIRTYSMTISTFTSDPREGKLVEHEIYYKVARRGKIGTVRKHLAKRGLKHFQQNVYRLAHRWPKKKYVRISFERESTARKSEPIIKIDIIKMVKKLGRWVARRFPSRTLSYARRRHKKWLSKR